METPLESIIFFYYIMIPLDFPLQNFFSKGSRGMNFREDLGERANGSAVLRVEGWEGNSSDNAE